MKHKRRGKKLKTTLPKAPQYAKDMRLMLLPSSFALSLFDGNEEVVMKELQNNHKAFDAEIIHHLYAHEIALVGGQYGLAGYLMSTTCFNKKAGRKVNRLFSNALDEAYTRLCKTDGSAWQEAMIKIKNKWGLPKEGVEIGTM